MSSLDERLRQTADRLAGAVPHVEVQQVAARRRQVRLVRRLQVATLVAVVIAATAGGTWGLTRVFRDSEVEPVATGPGVRNGKIAFVRSQRPSSRGAVPPNIFIMDPDGANPTQVSEDDAHKQSLDWSPDGTRLALVRGQDIWVMNADGSGLTALTSNERGQDDFPDWSPDGTRIAFTRSERSYCDTCPEGPSEKVLPHLHVMNADGSGIRQLTTGLWYEHDPTWSPDGSTIAFVRSKADIEGLNPPGYSPGVPTPPVIYVIAPEGSRQPGTAGPPPGPPELEAHELATMDLSAQGLEWSPDGKQFLFEAGSRIHTMNVDGTSEQAIPISGQGPDGLDMSAPAWSPDGTMIVFSASRGTYDDIYTVNSDGGGLTQLTDNLESFGSDYGPAWQPKPQGTFTVEPTPPGPDAIQGEREAAAEEALLRALTETFGRLCGMSSVGGDFDGDGGHDLAVVSYGSADGFCRGPAIKAWRLYVMWASGASGEWPLPECSRVCRAFAAADVDGDDVDEFFLLSDEGASTQFIRVFGLPLSPVGPTRFDVAPPGSQEFPGGGRLVLEYGGSVSHQAFVTCDQGDGDHHVIASTAALTDDRGLEWMVTETTFLFDSGASVESVVKEGVPERHANAFTVIATREYSVIFDSIGEDQLPIPGEPCWVLD